MRVLLSASTSAGLAFDKRAAIAAALVVVVIGSSGCHWFRKDRGGYAESAENRPLEVPPDLDMPNTQGAMKLPSADGTQSVTRSSMTTVPSAGTANGFTVPGERDGVFNQVGEALATIPGAVVASKAQLLGTYDMDYEGSKFLVRVTKVEAGVYISAVDPRGLPASGSTAVKLIGNLKTALSK